MPRTRAIDRRRDVHPTALAIAAEIRALSTPNVGNVRAVRRRFTRELRDTAGELVLIDQQGRICGYYDGMTDEEMPALLADIRRLVKQSTD